MPDYPDVKRPGGEPSPFPAISARAVKEAALGAGFSLCGIAPYRRLSEHAPRLEGWVADGMHGSLGYMERNIGKRTDPRELFPSTGSVVVCAVNYRNSAWDTPDDGRPRIASYAFSPDYHDSIKSMLRRMAETLRTIYPWFMGRMCTDTAPLLEKAWAVEAGLGWIGRNSLLVTPQFGSAVMLGELLLNARTDTYDRPYTRDGCGSCRRCVGECLAGAIGNSRTIDASRCFSRLTVEPGADELFAALPEDGDQPLSGWVFGCDGCQRCCPHNGAKPAGNNPLFRPVIDPTIFDKQFCREMDYARFETLFRGTPLERPGLDRVYNRIKILMEKE
ncbi:MAG: tRNA epoxyqueuosine(34) reductase QueG [Rikenellaceae bacterium]|nr:tRNA epoxyqueuosine(34) reductase QueG [Rikenellaceae bacterium]